MKRINYNIQVILITLLILSNFMCKAWGYYDKLNGVAIDSLTYSKNAYSLFQNESMATITASMNGGVATNCVSAPALPTGLTLNATTCAINGTPTMAQSAISYTITASNAANSTSTSLSLRIAGTTATRVYGQFGSFTCGVSNHIVPPGGCMVSSAGADTLQFPIGVAIDSTGGVYIADANNHRVLYYAAGSTTATRVYGQFGNFNCNILNSTGGNALVCGTANPTVPNADSLNSPTGVALDSSGGLYVVDYGNHRVLHFTGTSTTADRVYGQFGNFNCNILNSAGGNALVCGTTFASPSADSLNFPYNVAVNSTGVYIADMTNNRVLYYAGSSTTATRVYGQFNNFACSLANNGGVGCIGGLTSANSLNAPYGVALDSAGGLYIADYNNHRVLYYLGVSTTATRVYGQVDFMSNLCNRIGGVCTGTTPTANTLNNPQNITVDSNGGLYIADEFNHRVVYYPSGSTTATRVYGQLGSFLTNVVNNGGLNANSLNLPCSVAVDLSGNVYIVDYANHRVLMY